MIYVDRRLGGVETHFLECLPEDYGMRVPKAARKSICFICSKDRHKGQWIPGGTGFLVAWIGSGYSQIYLVTARHCVRDAPKGTKDWITGDQVHGDGHVYAGFNLRGGGVHYPRLKDEWLYPDDDTIDLAALPFDPEENYDIAVIPTQNILNSAKIQRHYIGLGDEIWVMGLFRPIPAKQSLRPIMRTGTIAAEAGLIETRDEQGNPKPPFFGYLVELRSIGGLSGSPVWVHLPYGRGYDQDNPPPCPESPLERRRLEILEMYGTEEPNLPNYLLGTIRLHWLTPTAQGGGQLQDLKSAGEVPGVLNMGIAAVTPIQALIDLLMREDVVKTRRDRLRRAVKKAGTER